MGKKNRRVGCRNSMAAFLTVFENNDQTCSCVCGNGLPHNGQSGVNMV